MTAGSEFKEVRLRSDFPCITTRVLCCNFNYLQRNTYLAGFMRNSFSKNIALITLGREFANGNVRNILRLNGQQPELRDWINRLTFCECKVH